MKQAENSWFWQDYWRRGPVACCLADDLCAGYDGALAAGWHSFFLGLGKGMQVLDLCTGNGGVALLGAQASTANNKAFDITGVDLALIEPATNVPAHREALQSITFDGGVDATDLPFGDVTFDAVTSQFGVEYAGMDAALDEAARVLKDGGRLRLVIHAVEGIAEAAARAEYALVGSFDFVELHNSLRTALVAVNSLTRGIGTKPAADAAVEAYIAAMEGLEAELARHPNQATILTLGRDLMTLFGALESMPIADVLERVDASERAVDAHRLRLEALMAAACDEKAIESVCERLGKLGIDANFHSASDGDGNMLAWIVEGVKE